jgi:hypothetical protein
MYGRTIMADAKEMTSALLLSSASHMIPTKAIRFFRKLSFNTPRKFVKNRGSHFVFGLCIVDSLMADALD